MPAKSRNVGENTILNKLFGRKRKPSRKGGSLTNRGSRNLQLEGLEKREMFAVSSLYLSGGALAVYTDNAATSVTVSQVGSNIRISEVGTNRQWDYAASQVGRVDFVGGAGNDRFVNNVSNLATRAWGQGGDDYLEGYNNVDIFVGGDGHDTLVGYGGNDQMWGGAGNDVLRGMNGDDQMVGDAGNDHFDGGAGNDKMWGGDGADVMLGGTGDDEIVGDAGNDRLNGQAGVDKMWAGDGNDVLISIDTAFNEFVDSGTGADTMWIDNASIGWFSFSDNVVGATSSDVVQRVSSFANGADRTLDGDNVTDPTDSGTKLRYNNTITAGNTQGSNPLFSSSGPNMADVTQGGVGDCWLLAGLGAISLDSPHAVRHNVVDFDDGTYGVRLGNSFYRVDNELPVINAQSGATTQNLRYAEFGYQNSMWVAIVEKAFAHYRTGANTYASLDGGWSVEVNRAFRSTSAGEKRIRDYSSAADLANDIYNRYWGFQSVTIGFTGNLVGNVPLIANHMYTVAGVARNSAGVVTSITLRNPHGANTSQHGVLVTLTPDQLWAQREGFGRVNWGRV